MASDSDSEDAFVRAIEGAIARGVRAEDAASDADVRAVGMRTCARRTRRGDAAKAADALEFLGFTHRLSDRVLRYALPRDGLGDGERAEGGIVEARDGALEARTLARLERAFASETTSFWREHGYGSKTCGFFSYVHDLTLEPTSAMDVVALDVRAVAARAFPEAATARWCEWWAHRRPHESGHQMHFDSHDEGLNGIKHPICSAVVYVDGSCGGPTLVTNQTDSRARLATRGWLVYPKTGRVATFDGNYLHGVIPGRDEDAPEDPETRRVTVMFSFWRDMETHETWQPQGSARPFPPPEASSTPGYAWRALFDLDDSEPAYRTRKDDDDFGVEALPHPVGAPWERIRLDEDRASKRASRDAFPSYDACFQGF